MKNPFANYSKDGAAKICAAFIVVFLICVVLAEPSYWPVAVIVLVFFACVFYFMRNNP